MPPVLKNLHSWAFLLAQWLRICLPMQRTRVRALVQEDPTYRGATHAPQLLSLRSRGREPQLLSPRATTTDRKSTRLNSSHT